MSKKVIGATIIIFATLFANAQDQKVNKNKPASIALKGSILMKALATPPASLPTQQFDPAF